MPSPVVESAAPVLRIATFNIQNFGRQKLAKEEIVAQLVRIVRKYDVVAVQEISDVTNQVGPSFLAKINAAGGTPYGMVLSERSGREPANRTSAEQYAFYFNTATVEKQGDGQLYPDGASDEFEREPFVAGFRARAGGTRFVLITVHTAPEKSRREIPALGQALAWARARYEGQDGFVILGDFNASGSYASASDLARWRANELNYRRIVGDDSDSNVSTASARAYDRIVATDGMAARYGGKHEVDRAFTDAAVSDHWPVWAEFRMGTDATK